MVSDLLEAWIGGKRIRALAAELGRTPEEVEAELEADLRALSERIAGETPVPAP